MFLMSNGHWAYGIVVWCGLFALLEPWALGSAYGIAAPGVNSRVGKESIKLTRREIAFQMIT